MNLTRLAATTAWLFLAATCALSPAVAQTYISAEPIPTADIIGQPNLDKMLALGYPKLELWSFLLLNECRIVPDTITALTDYKAISTVLPANTLYSVAAGGFEGVTDPSYVFRIEDSGPLAVSPADIFVLDNALGYVLNQGSTAQFSLRLNPNDPNVFPLDYAIVTLNRYLTGEQAAKFFNYVGTIDPALWSGSNAGFTQISLRRLNLNNAMLFLIGDVSTQEFTQGLFKAASTTPDAKYRPLDNNGNPTTATAGAAFPFNDWVMSPNGDGYLTNLGNASPQLLNALSALRQKHLAAVSKLLSAIDQGHVERYLTSQFTCP